MNYMRVKYTVNNLETIVKILLLGIIPPIYERRPLSCFRNIANKIISYTTILSTVIYL